MVCHRASFRPDVVCIPDDDETLNLFAPFIAGFVTPDETIQAAWRNVCRALGRQEASDGSHLQFSVTNIMAAFTQHATALPELMTEAPVSTKVIKNSQARSQCPAKIIRPTEIREVQECVRWALRKKVGLTVVGGGHSGHCIWPNVVAVDMSAFDKVHIIKAESNPDAASLVVAEAGCRTGDIVREAMRAGLAVPLGSRPSVGAGLWLQGGIGHLTRLHGLTCDAIVGAVVISVESGETLSVGSVPSQYRLGGIAPRHENDLLWATKGAGTNFGIVISVTFKAYAAPIYSVRNWVVPLNDRLGAMVKLNEFNDTVARNLPRDCSADAFLYSHNDRLHLGVTTFETSAHRTNVEPITPTSMAAIFGPQASFKAVDGLAVFEAEMYMSGMHGGHGGGKTSSFKRCLFLKDVGEAAIIEILVSAIETRPTQRCYVHLLHGGGALRDVAADSSAFGCRDWDFACVITGVWPRYRDGTQTEAAAVGWVYKVARDLLPLSSGVYSADLGPDPRDGVLAAQAFGPNVLRLTRLKEAFDPHNILAYACPLPKAREKLRLVVLVTGDSGAGKDYCSFIWVSAFTDQGHTARAVSISEVTKREYAAATGADLDRLFQDRDYKEQHRPDLTKFFHDQVQQHPRLLEKQFISVVRSAEDVDVLLVTGMRDEAPVATFSHLVPESRLLEVRVEANEETRLARRGCYGKIDKDSNGRSNCASLTFLNEACGSGSAEAFARTHLIPFLHPSLQKLAAMACPISDFPRPGIEFRHILNISQQPGGLELCSSLLHTHFTGDWAKVSTIASIEVGGIVFASALAARVQAPLALIRKAGKLPPPTVEVMKESSHIAEAVDGSTVGEKIAIELTAIPREGLIVLLDDVLATGTTLCAMLRLLRKAGVGVERLRVIVVAEFPFHQGRALLHQQGFKDVIVQSLLVFSGA
ncbi:hypothetical protein N0V82_002342 [Gnomoniopsis sp. IMI 355080]|nr:hypothetical protein N0V82_002342 [Gnomoniopsis sp. IMI 355080]